MQDVNNDMDELFRKATEHYPLRRCDSKWDEIAPKIRSKKNTVLFPVLFSRDRNPGKSFLFGLLILIPFAIFSVLPALDKNRLTRIHSKEVQASKTGNATSTGNRPLISWSVPGLSGMNHKNNTGGQKYSYTGKRLLPFNSSFPPLSPEAFSLDMQASDILIPYEPEKEIKYSRVETVKDYNPLIAGYYFLFPASDLETKHSPDLSAPLVQNYLPLQHIAQPGRRGFYLGALAGPMMSQVKNQGVTKSGLDFGLQLGYRFSKKVSIETGLMRTKQYYSVEGDYLKTILGTDGVKNLQGNREAFSIPLALKYNVVISSGGNFFLTAGLLSFVGVNDHIWIQSTDVALPPTIQFDLGTASYLPAYTSFSMGYEFNVGKFSNIRIEPYMEIPINNSAGNSFTTHVNGNFIQVVNSGIHIGISRFIH